MKLLYLYGFSIDIEEMNSSHSFVIFLDGVRLLTELVRLSADIVRIFKKIRTMSGPRTLSVSADICPRTFSTDIFSYCMISILNTCILF